MKLVQRATAILLTPRTEWPVIEREPATLTGLFIDYVAILAAIPAVAGFIGQSLIGGYTPVLSGLLRSAVVFAAAFAVVYVIASVIDLLARYFGGRKDFPNAVKLAVYSHTPVWLAGVFLLIPGLTFLVILGLYGVYLLWTGLPILMRVPSEKVRPYTILVAVCAVIPAIILAVI